MNIEEIKTIANKRSKKIYENFKALEKDINSDEFKNSFNPALVDGEILIFRYFSTNIETNKRYIKTALGTVTKVDNPNYDASLDEEPQSIFKITVVKLGKNSNFVNLPDAGVKDFFYSVVYDPKKNILKQLKVPSGIYPLKKLRNFIYIDSNVNGGNRNSISLVNGLGFIKLDFRVNTSDTVSNGGIDYAVGDWASFSTGKNILFEIPEDLQIISYDLYEQPIAGKKGTIWIEKDSNVIQGMWLENNTRIQVTINCVCKFKS